MNAIFLGDSYDVVKRLWQEMLLNWAPLYAALCRFVWNLTSQAAVY